MVEQIVCACVHPCLYTNYNMFYVHYVFLSLYTLLACNIILGSIVQLANENRYVCDWIDIIILYAKGVHFTAGVYCIFYIVEWACSTSSCGSWFLCVSRVLRVRVVVAYGKMMIVMIVYG